MKIEGREIKCRVEEFHFDSMHLLTGIAIPPINANIPNTML